MKAAMVIALIAIGLFAFGGVALATSPPQNGPATPALGDPVGGEASPHGGYSSSTNYCLQCHSMHDAGDYALLAENNVTDTCNTCHKVFGVGGTDVVDSNALIGAPVGSLLMGTAATRSAYDLASAAGEHTLGADTSPTPDNTLITGADWGYRQFPNRGINGPPSVEAAGPGTAYTANGGLYCGSCHTPHGEFGQLINSRYYRSTAGDTGAVNEIQVVTVPGTVTTWTLRFSWPTPPGGSSTTGTITQPATDGTVRAELESFLGAGNVSVVGPDGGPFTITFIGTYAGTDVNQLTATLTGGTGSITVSTTVQGHAAGITLETVRVWQNNAQIYQYAGSSGTSPTVFYLYNDAGLWKKCPVPTTDPAWALGNCSNLTKTNRSGAATDDIGQTGIYLYGYKLLSAYPNHNYGTPESWGVGYRDTDAARWCGACHASKVSEHMGAPFTSNSHPTACGYCHGIPADQSTLSTDYPHTSTKDNFLISYPDGLCIGSCHTAGSLT